MSENDVGPTAFDDWQCYDPRTGVPHWHPSSMLDCPRAVPPTVAGDESWRP